MVTFADSVPRPWQIRSTLYIVHTPPAENIAPINTPGLQSRFDSIKLARCLSLAITFKYNNFLVTKIIPASNQPSTLLISGDSRLIHS